MFDEVTKREGGKRAARRGAFLLGSSAVQVIVVLSVIFLSSAIAAKVSEGPLVPVKIVKSATPPPPPPPPPPAPRRKTAPKPKTDTPKPRPVSAMAMIQPKEVPLELKQVDKSAPIDEPDEGSDDGVEGGVIGGVVGGTAPAGGPSIEDAPAYVTAGAKAPQQAQRNCVQSTVRIPQGLQGFVSAPVTVKFAIGADGRPSLFQVMGSVADQRIAGAIWQAIQQCSWVPGANAQGRPAKYWVILPIRFQSG